MVIGREDWFSARASVNALVPLTNYCTTFIILLPSSPISLGTMKAFSLLPIATLVFLLNIPNTANSQVLIPDHVMRGWLNTMIPGIVDANGIMDTLNPAIATVDSMGFNFPYDPLFPVDTIDLEGIQYMHSLRSFLLQNTGTSNLIVECSALPMSLSNLYCYVNFGFGINTIYLPQLPINMERISIDHDRFS